MAEENKNQQTQKVSLNTFNSGLVTDTFPVNQIDGTYRFALNAVNESSVPKHNAISNEESNILSADFSNEYVIGKIDVGNNDFVIFTVSYNNGIKTSKIYIYNTESDNKTVLFDDTNSSSKFDFNEHKQIEGLFRLRNGCERIIYWTDDRNVPRCCNIDREDKYLDSNNYPVASKFNLIKSYKSVPIFLDSSGRFGVRIINGGHLKPGAYNVSLRYIDSDFNATSWTTVTDSLIVYNASPSDSDYTKVKGSTSKISEYQKFGETDKAISVSIVGNSLDTDFEYYQLGLIEMNNGTGINGNIALSPKLPISSDPVPYYTYIFDGLNSNGTEDIHSLPYDQLIVGKAKTITDNNNRLLLGNVEGKHVNWCKLQKYASKISSKCVIKEIELKNLSDVNCIASGNYNNDDVGYMPGETYSFGIVYIFDDGSKSPVYHIPGPYTDSIYTSSKEVTEYPMASSVCENMIYTENSCPDEDPNGYWGLDYTGHPLKNQPVRHHKFPTRTQLNLPLYRKIEPSSFVETYGNTYCLWLHTKGNHIDSRFKREFNEIKLNVGVHKPGVSTVEKEIPVTISIEEWEASYQSTISPTNWDGSVVPSKASGGWLRIELGTFDYIPQVSYISEKPQLYVASSGDNGTRYGWATSGGHIRCGYKALSGADGLEGKDYGGDPERDRPSDTGDGVPDVFNRENKHLRTSGHKDFTIYYVPEDQTYVSATNHLAKNVNPAEVAPAILRNSDFIIKSGDSSDIIYKVPILGIEFENIDIPTLEDTNQNKIIGYYIVRNKRDESNKTILDSAVVLPVKTDIETSRDYDDSTVEYLAYGHSLELDNDTYSYPEAKAFINPEFLFLDKKYYNFTFVTDGEEPIDTNINPSFNGKRFIEDNGIIHCAQHLWSFNGHENFSSHDTQFITNDVQPGSSYDKSVNKKREEDSDGFDLYTFAVEGNLTAKSHFISSSITPNKIDYVAPLEHCKLHNGKILYNISCDNKIGIMSGSNVSCKKFTYGYLKRHVSDPYGNFRGLSYYKDSKNIHPASNGQTDLISGEIYSGDVYVSPMKYTNSVFYQNKLKNRSRKRGLWQIITGAVVTVAGVAVGVGTGALPLAMASLSAGLSLLTNGINIMNSNKVYGRLYSAGLKNTISNSLYQRKLSKTDMVDDQIQWVSEILNSIWFESTINMFWRDSVTIDFPSFLTPLSLWDSHEYSEYLKDKFTIIDDKSNNERLYCGFAKAEYYRYNPDYLIKNPYKIFTHLPLEYNCCSSCFESFPHRVLYSEKSFVEEKTDNYRKFLPLNYKDVEGIKGEITALISYKNDMIALCEEGSWYFILNSQPLAIGNIISYIGTGDLFDVAPKPYDMACQHQFSISKYESGIVFVDSFNKCVWSYGLNTSQHNVPSEISANGMRKYFFENINTDDERYHDNPACRLGGGYITGYDPKNQRLLVTAVKNYIPNINEYIEANGKIYQIGIHPEKEDYEYVGIDEENGTYVYRKQIDHQASWKDLIYVPGTERKEVLSSIDIKIKYIDKDGNTLSSADLMPYGISFPRTLTGKFYINNTEYVFSFDPSPDVYSDSYRRIWTGPAYFDSKSTPSLNFPFIDQYNLYLRNISYIGVMYKKCNYRLYYDIEIMIIGPTLKVSGTYNVQFKYYRCENESWHQLTGSELDSLSDSIITIFNEKIEIPIEVLDYETLQHLRYDWNTRIHTNNFWEDFRKYNTVEITQRDGTPDDSYTVMDPEFVPSNSNDSIGTVIYRIYDTEGQCALPTPVTEECNLDYSISFNYTPICPDKESLDNEFVSSPSITINDTQYLITLSEYTERFEGISYEDTIINDDCDIDPETTNVSFNLLKSNSKLRISSYQLTKNIGIESPFALSVTLDEAECRLQAEITFEYTELYPNVESVLNATVNYPTITIDDVVYNVTMDSYIGSEDEVTFYIPIDNFDCSTDIYDYSVQFNLFTPASCITLDIMSFSKDIEDSHLYLLQSRFIVSDALPMALTSPGSPIILSGDNEVECVPGTEGSFQFVTNSTPYYDYEYATEPLADVTVTPIHKGWTLSFNTPNKCWTSFHSYIPNMYLNNNETFFSLFDSKFWKHGVQGSFCNFYGAQFNYIIDFISINNSSLVNAIWGNVEVMVDVYRFDPSTNEFFNVRNIFFNKAILYNQRQCSGEITLIPKESIQGSSYLPDSLTGSYVDNNEGLWSFNNFRDMIGNNSYNAPIFLTDKTVLQSNYFIDKIINTSVIDSNKPWFNRERFRGKYLDIRLIFDPNEPTVGTDPDNIKFVTYLTINSLKESER